MVKLCKDCKHCVLRAQEYAFFFIPILSLEHRQRYAKCDKLVEDQVLNLVTGKMEPPKPEYRYASVVREFRCGLEAKWFEPKDVNTP